MGAPLYIMSWRRVTDKMWGWPGPSSCSSSARVIAGENGSCVEVWPRPWGPSQGGISSSVSRGSGRLEGLHSEAICEQVWVELCAGPQL